MSHSSNSYCFCRAPECDPSVHVFWGGGYFLPALCVVEVGRGQEFTNKPVYPGLLPTPPQILCRVPCLSIFLIRSYTVWEPQSIGIWPPGLCSWVGMMTSLALPAAVAFVALTRHVDLFLRISSRANRVKRDLSRRVRS